MPWHELACPGCGRDDCLDVEATLMIRLTEDGSDADLSEDGGQIWDNDSSCICTSCRTSGKVLSFRSPSSGS